MATVRDAQGRLYDVDDAELDAVLVNPSFRVASPDEIQAWDAAKAQREQYGTTGQQALGLVEAGLGAASFGLIEGLGEGAAERKAELKRQSPFLTLGATALGAAAPALVTGGAAGAASAAAGLGRAARVGATLVAEGAAGGLAEEAERVRHTEEAIDYWNALGWGIGGAVLGHGLGQLIRRGSIVADNVLARAERKALEADARGARRAPAGPEKSEAVARSGEQVIDQAADEIAGQLERAAPRLERLRAEVPRARLDELVADGSPAQRSWASEVARQAREELGLATDAPSRARARARAAAGGEDRLRRVAEAFGAERAPEPDAGSAFRGRPPPTATSRAVDTLADAASDPVDVWQAAQTLVRELPADSAVRAQLRRGVEDPALFGQAARLAERLNQAGPVRAFSPDELRRVLGGDAAAAKGARAQLDATLDTLDQLIETQREFGLGDADDLVRVRDVVRQELASSDAARVARAARDTAVRAQDGAPGIDGGAPAPPARGFDVGGMVGDVLRDRALGMASSAVGALVGGPVGAVVGGLGAGVAKEAIGRVLRNMSGAQRAAVARAARGFVGRGARASSSAVRALSPGGVPTILGTFQEDYASPEASYLAKVEALRAASADPSALPRVMAASFGDLPVHYPRAFANASAQMQRALGYLTQNLPPSTAASLISPRGLPPSREQVRDFAVLWNSVTAPETVLEALAEGTATPKQIEALKAVHPGVYEQVRLDVMNEIARAPTRLPTQTKIWLDLLFDLDGAAGLAYSSEAGRLFRAQPEEATPGAPPVTQPPEMTPPAGIASMQSGPTMSA